MTSPQSSYGHLTPLLLWYATETIDTLAFVGDSCCGGVFGLFAVTSCREQHACNLLVVIAILEEGCARLVCDFFADACLSLGPPLPSCSPRKHEIVKWLSWMMTAR